MKKLNLSKEETSQLFDNGVVTVVRHGFEVVVELIDYPSECWDYKVTIVNPYDGVIIF